jgi:hypothetical protein
MAKSWQLGYSKKVALHEHPQRILVNPVPVELVLGCRCQPSAQTV